MDNRREKPDSREERLNDVLGAYLEAEDAGWAPDRTEFLTRYPDLKADLEVFFATRVRVADVARAYVFLTPGHRKDKAKRNIADVSTTGTLTQQPPRASVLGNFFRGGWDAHSFLTGVGEALMLFPPPPSPPKCSDIDALATDVERVLCAFATVLQRHGHDLEASGEKPNGA